MSRRLTSFALSALMAGLPVTPGWAAPAGEVVVEGKAEFTRDGNETIIDTFTTETIVEYDRFDIGRDERVQINQPTDHSRILNHVPHGDPSAIFGELESNGFVFILNPAGVFLGDTALIDVGGLVAAAGSMSYEDFLEGRDRFVDLQGDVTVERGAMVEGLRGVALLGRRVASHGTVVAEQGLVAFVAGDNAMLASLDGHLVLRVDDAGEASDFALAAAGPDADAGGGGVVLSAGDTTSLALNHTGVTRGRDIHLEAKGDGLVQVAGSLDASRSGAGETGGRVHVLGDRIALYDAQIDASGAAAGGEILVGGDLRGEGDVRTARRTFVGSEAELVADALSKGDGGKIIVWADEATGFYGRASARGGAESGDGGFVEISGARFLEARGHEVDLSAANGSSGTLLYDPDDIEIVGGGPTDGSDTDADPLLLVGDDDTAGRILDGDEGDMSTPFLIYESEIEGTDADIVLEARQSISVAGDASTFTNEVDGEGDGVVVITPGNSLVVETSGAAPVDPDDPDPDNPTQFLTAIDLGQDLTWRVSDGGLILVRTQSSTDADIVIGRLEFLGREYIASEEPELDGFDEPLVVFDENLDAQGLPVDADRAVFVQTNAGDIEIGSILANGDDAGSATLSEGPKGPGTRFASNAPDVEIRAGTGNIVVGEIQATGGGAAGNPSGNPPQQGATGRLALVRKRGGDVTIVSDAGEVRVTGPIDVSGGDGQSGFIEEPDGVRAAIAGDGGDGGSILLDAPGSAGKVIVTGDLIANGGAGTGVIAALDPNDGTTRTVGGSGGRFGGIDLFASEAIEVLGAAADDRVRIEASGGDGVFDGGPPVEELDLVNAIVITASPPPLGETEPAAIQLVLQHADLVSNGGSVTPGGPGGSGGNAGGIFVDAGEGEVLGATATITANGGDGRLGVEGEGERSPPFGGATSVTVLTGGAGVAIGDIVARGGRGQRLGDLQGRGGSVQVSSTDGNVSVAGIDVSGGDVLDPNRLDPLGGAPTGGNGGEVTLATGEIEDGDQITNGGSVLLGGAIVAEAGEGADLNGDPVFAQGGIVSITSEVSVQASAAGASIRAGGTFVTAPEIGSADMGTIGVGGTDADADLVRLTVTEAIGTDVQAGVNLLEDHRLESLDVVHSADTAASNLSRSDGGSVTPMLVVDAAVTGVTPQKITRMDTAAEGDPRLAFTLNRPNVDGMVPAPAAVEIAAGAGTLGDGGATITNSNGALLGEVAGTPHLTTAGDLRLDATSIGADGEPLILDAMPGPGADPLALELEVTGDLDVQVVNAFGGIQLVQRDAKGGARLELEGGTESILIEAATDDEEPTLQVMSGSTEGSGSDFAYILTDEELPGLRIAGLSLGGDAVVNVTGDLELGDGVSTDPALGFGSGQTVVLAGQGDLTWRPGAGGQVAIEQVGAVGAESRKLVLVAGGSVASDAGGAIVTSGLEGDVLEIAGGAEGDFRVAHQTDAVDPADPSELQITEIEVPDPLDQAGEFDPLVQRGIGGASAVGGDVEVANRDGDIVFGTLPGSTHIAADGDVTVAGSVLIDNELELVGEDAGSENRSRILAGGDVTFTDTIDTSAALAVPGNGTHAQLLVEAGGIVGFGGDVGGTNALGSLDTTAARASGTADDTRTFHVPQATFRGGIEGPARVVLPAALTEAALIDPDTDSFARFGGDLGGRTALRSLDVEADEIRFDVDGGASAERVRATDHIHLDTNTTEVPSVATISDSLGNLQFETDGTFSLGDGEGGGAGGMTEYEKLSVVGSLGIAAANVKVMDLSAGRITIDSLDIELMTRPAGDVELPNGTTTTDDGVDWVANDIVLSSNPNPTSDLPVTFYLGSGSISVPGNLERFNVSRLNSDFGAVTPVAFIGPEGDVLDLTGDGPPLYGDPAREMLREQPLLLPKAPPRLIGGEPAPEPQVQAGQVLAFLRCGDASLAAGADCTPDEASALASVKRFQDTALATPRADEITERYRELLAAPGAVERLRAAFATAGEGYATGQEWRDANVDGAALYRYLESAPETQRPALAKLNELAWLFTEIELLDLTEADTRRLQQTLAQEFSDAADLPGFSAEAVTAAVEASPIGLVQ